MGYEKEGLLDRAGLILRHCIRMERPIDPGRSLLENPLDTTYLLSCFRDQKPMPVAIGKPVPVFVVYQTVDVDPAGKLAWYKDIYQLRD